LIGLGIFIILASIVLIVSGDITVPGIIGLPVGVASIFINYLLMRYNECGGKDLGSAAMVANAFQAKADIYTTIAVCIGILVSQISPSFAVFDHVAALLVGIMIVKESFEQWKINFRVIIDQHPRDEYEKNVKTAVREIYSGNPAHTIKLKRTGKNYWLGIGLELPRAKKIHDMDKETNKIKHLLRQRHKWINEIDFFLE